MKINHAAWCAAVRKDLQDLILYQQKNPMKLNEIVTEVAREISEGLRQARLLGVKVERVDTIEVNLGNLVLGSDVYCVERFTIPCIGLPHPSSIPEPRSLPPA